MDHERRFAHEAWFYDDTDIYVTWITEFAALSRAANEPFLLAVPGERHPLLEERMPADGVTLVDLSEDGKNPGRIIASILTRFMDDHAGQRVNVVIEPVWEGRSSAAYAAAIEHEALTNLAFAERDATIVCAYDRRALDIDTIVDAHETHPYIRDCGGFRASRAYVDPLRMATAAIGEPAPAPAHASTTVFYDLHTVRDVVRKEAERARMSRSRAADVKAAVNEIAANSLRHGGGEGELTWWRDSGELIVEIRDRGRIDDPLVGRRVPTRVRPGRGLLVAHLLCDLLQVWRGPAGTTVRMWIGIAGDRTAS